MFCDNNFLVFIFFYTLKILPKYKDPNAKVINWFPAIERGEGVNYGMEEVLESGFFSE